MVGLFSPIYWKNSWEVEQMGAYGRTPLHNATRSGRPESAKFLLDCGASSHIEDSMVVDHFILPRNSWKKRSV